MEFARHVPSDEGKAFNLAEELRVKVHTRWVNRNYLMFEHAVAPGTLGMPHVHENEDQVSFILEGSLGFYVGGDEFVASKGSAIFRPRGVPHALWNPTAGPARMLEISSPGGFEDYFGELEEALRAGQNADVVAEIQRRWGITSLPKLVGALEARHNVRLKI